MKKESLFQITGTVQELAIGRLDVATGKITPVAKKSHEKSSFYLKLKTKSCPPKEQIDFILLDGVKFIRGG